MLCINLGQVAATGVPMKLPKAYKSWSQLEKAPRYVFILQIFNFNVTSGRLVKIKYSILFVFVSLSLLMISNC